MSVRSERTGAPAHAMIWKGLYGRDDAFDTAHRCREAPGGTSHGLLFRSLDSPSVAHRDQLRIILRATMAAMMTMSTTRTIRRMSVRDMSSLSSLMMIGVGSGVGSTATVEPMS